MLETTDLLEKTLIWGGNLSFLTAHNDIFSLKQK